MQNPSTFHFDSTEFQHLLKQLAAKTGELNSIQNSAVEQLRLLADANVLGWGIPKEYGGSELLNCEMTSGYEKLASACLLTTFVLTQQNGACQRIAGSENSELKEMLLPSITRGEIFATVGISHLTTSRQHFSKPAVGVSIDGDQMVFNGMVPWVTGANHAQFIVTGGTCHDNRQVLAAIPTHLPGVEVQPPIEMLSMSASQTSAIKLSNVTIDAKYLIAGPVDNVMQQGLGGGTGSLATSALAIGSAAASLQGIQKEAGARPDLLPIYEPLKMEYDDLQNDMYSVADCGRKGKNSNFTSEVIRRRANSLVLRTSQAYLAASKGAGFVTGHPAERAVREAMFFLVWSCPQPVLQAALEEFACTIDR
ncbi:Butyryl-CoA dehydrogenase [hydrothermal vent metagenome]|uniref:Butyryl-CoA dehydrogenase n=1 Tax=hydrothermal vent metagenome TaxID=652676 RepID=A0A3B1D4X7_9ZZZZ